MYRDLSLYDRKCIAEALGDIIERENGKKKDEDGFGETSLDKVAQQQKELAEDWEEWE